MSRKLFVPLGLSPSGYLLKCDPYSVIAAGMNVAGNIATNQINAERAASDMATYLNLVKRQREWQLADYESNQERTKDLMDYERDYNTPKEQMQRLKDAGLNPYLASHDGNIGTGNGSSAPTPSLPSRGSVLPMQRPPLDNVFNSPIDKIMQGASIQNQKTLALSEFAKSLPDLIKGAGKDTARSIAQTVYGRLIDTSTIDSYINLELSRSEIAKNREQIEADIVSEFSREQADAITKNLWFTGQKIMNEAQELIDRSRKHGSDIKVNEESIKELITRETRNLAEASHLRADSETLNKLRPYVVKSADMKSSMDEYSKMEQETLYQQRKEARAWQRSPEGRKAASAAQTIYDNPETNLVNKILHGKEHR